MESIIQITLIGLAAGILGTGLGALITTIAGRPRRQVVSFILGFAGGIMVAIIFMDLLPEAMEIGGFFPGFGGLLLGVGLIAVLDYLLPHTHLFSNRDQNSRLMKAGAILAIGVALHNLPEGLAIGVGYVASPELGLTLAAVIALHNIPEGLALSSPMLAAGLSRGRILLVAMLAGVPMGLGAYLGAVVGSISPLLLSSGLGFAGGAMLYIVFDELMPQAHRLAEGYTATLGVVAGVVAYLAVSHLI